MFYINKFATFLILVCFVFTPQISGAFVCPPDQLNCSPPDDYDNPKTGQQYNRVLAGLVVSHGEIIDAIQPIYRKINDNGSLGETTKEQQQGGNGENLTEIYRDDFVVVGFIYSTGEWSGTTRIAGLYAVLQKWENGKPKGDRIIFGPFGLIDKINYGQAILKTPSEGLYVSNLQVNKSDVYVSNIGVFFAGEEIKSEAKPEQKNANVPFTPDDNYYKFDIKIVSGSKTGLELQGIASFPSENPNGVVSANRFVLRYANNCFTMENIDGTPHAQIDGNNISKLAFTGGPGNNRFGLNIGFSRNQFGRDEESFVRNGEEYFGYLDPNTYVDGVGTVQYRKLDDNEKSLYNELSCK